MKKYQIHESNFRHHVQNYDGLCVSCSCWTTGGVEGDAKGYQCEGCDQKKVYGAELAMIAGILDIVGDDDEIPETAMTKE